LRAVAKFTLPWTAIRHDVGSSISSLARRMNPLCGFVLGDVRSAAGPSRSQRATRSTVAGASTRHARLAKPLQKSGEQDRSWSHVVQGDFGSSKYVLPPAASRSPQDVPGDVCPHRHAPVCGAQVEPRDRSLISLTRTCRDFESAKVAYRATRAAQKPASAPLVDIPALCTSSALGGRECTDGCAPRPFCNFFFGGAYASTGFPGPLAMHYYRATASALRDSAWSSAISPDERPPCVLFRPAIYVNEDPPS